MERQDEVGRRAGDLLPVEGQRAAGFVPHVRGDLGRGEARGGEGEEGEGRGQQHHGGGITGVGKWRGLMSYEVICRRSARYIYLETAPSRQRERRPTA